jgi:putative ABC transport system substrate-binding protein
MIPAATRVGLLVNATNPNAASVAREIEPAARALDVQLHRLTASTPRELETVFATLQELRAHALVIGPDPFFNTRYAQLGALTIRHAMPTVYQYREFAAAGGLMSYGGDIKDLYRRAGAYAGRVLNGEMPAELPIQQSAKAELFVNLKTTKALGITVPLSLLARADEVIE